MKKRGLIIAIPIKGIGGGFFRSYQVLYNLIELSNNIDYEIYIPITTILNILIYDINSLKSIFDLIDKIDKDLIISSILDKYIDLIKNKFYIYKKFLSNPINYITGFTPIYLSFIKNIENNLINLYFRRLDNIDFIYLANENVEAMYSLYKFALKYRPKVALMIQSTPYFEPSFSRSIFTPRAISSIYLSRYIKHIILTLAREGMLRLLMAVSPAPILETKSLLDILKKYSVPAYIPIPAVAFNPIFLFSRNRLIGRPMRAVFFSRLNPLKGIYDLLYVWKKIEDTVPDAELHIAGIFEKTKYMERFFHIKRALGIRNVYYHGYLNHDEIYKLLSNARLLIYPSYSDSFSLTVLESLASGVSVVAYDIPALRFVYRGLPPVRLVPRGNIEAMAREAVRLLLMDDSRYEELHRDPRVEEFLRLHSSWREVAQAEMRALDRFLLTDSQGM